MNLISLEKSKTENHWSKDAEILSVYAGMDSMTWRLGLVGSLNNASFQKAISKLSDEALVPNPFFDVPFLKAATKHLDDDQVKYVFLSKVIGQEEQLKLFAPVTLSSIGFIPRKVLRTWNHPYAPLGMPLVSENTNGETLKAFIECVENAHHKEASAIVFEQVAKEGRFITDLYRSRQLADRLLLAVGTPRAGLKPVQNLNYVETHFSGSRKQRLRRASTELHKLGKVVFENFNHPKTMKKPLEEFLNLEAQGWKGTKKTALNSTPQTAAFCWEAVQNAAQEKKCQIHSLKLNDKTIASLITFECKGYFYPWKIAFDESYAKYSVGNMLAIHATSEFAQSKDFKGLDSLAAEHNQNTFNLWPDKKELFTMTIGIGKHASRTTLRITNELNRLRRIKTTLRRLIKR